jgi:hypothetical protein
MNVPPYGRFDVSVSVSVTVQAVPPIGIRARREGVPFLIFSFCLLIFDLVF